MSGTNCKTDPEDMLPNEVWHGAAWGKADAPVSVDWKYDPTPDPDDEELAATPPDIIAMLGFDPKDTGDVP